jgi:hypothetical protein
MAVSVNPGVILWINQQTVELGPNSPDNTNPAENGAEYTLGDPVDLGTAKDLSGLLSSEFGASLPDVSNIPAPLDKVYDSLSTMTLSITKFDLHLPPTKDSSGKALPAPKQATFSLGLNLEFPPGGELSIFGGLKVKGLYLNITKTDDTASGSTTKPPPTPAKPKPTTPP